MPHESAASRAGEASGWRAALVDPPAVRFAVVAALIGCGAGLFAPYLNVFFVRVLGASPAVYGWLSAAGTLVRLAGTITAPRLAKRFGPVRAIAWTQLASVPLLLALGFAPQLLVGAAAYLVRGALMNMAAPINTGFTMATLAPARRGAGTSLVWLASNAARTATTVAGGALIAAGQPGGGYRVPYALTAVCYVASVALFLRWFGKKPNA